MVKKTAKKSVKKKTAKKAKKVTKKVASSKKDDIERKVVRHTPRKNPKPDKAVAIVALILNILIMPGLGTLIGGKVKEGIWQLVLLFGGAVIGILLIVSVIALPLGILLVIFGPLIAWIWALVSGVQLIQESQ
tara:strand:+ start:381 stop:779 length:399 start_codon:yes stop_codon:yes gene_type:complete